MLDQPVEIGRRRLLAAESARDEHAEHAGMLHQLDNVAVQPALRGKIATARPYLRQESLERLAPAVDRRLFCHRDLLRSSNSLSTRRDYQY
jgi:hypothetical protein